MKSINHTFIEIGGTGFWSEELTSTMFQHGMRRSASLILQLMTQDSRV